MRRAGMDKAAGRTSIGALIRKVNLKRSEIAVLPPPDQKAPRLRLPRVRPNL